MGWLDEQLENAKKQTERVTNPIKDAVGRVTNPIKDAVGGLEDPLKRAIGTPVDGLIDAVIPPSGGPEIPPVDPRLEQIKKNQMDQAKKFRGNLGAYKEEQYGGAASGARTAMASRLNATKGDYNRRGLLYSDFRQSAEADQAGQIMGGLAEERASISADLDAAADLYDQQALKSELAINEAEADISRQLYDRAISERMAKRGALGGLISGGAQVGGAYLARKT